MLRAVNSLILFACLRVAARNVTFVQVDLDLYQVGEPQIAPEVEVHGNNSRQLRGPTIQRQSEVEITLGTGAVSTGGRQLQTTTQVSLVFLAALYNAFPESVIMEGRRGSY